MSDVLINFIIGNQSIDETAAKLDKMTDAEEQLRAQAKKTYADMDNAQTRIASSIDKMTAASKSMDKSIVAGAYKNYLKTIQKELGLTEKEIKDYIKIARQAAQENLLTTEDAAQVKEFETVLSVLNETLEEFNNKEEQSAQKTKTFRQEIKEAELALKEMYEAGKAGTPEFDQLQQKIGDLKDEYGDFQNTFKTLGSDTRNIDGLISLMGGVAGGFAVAQGSAALFGEENEEVQKALLKVNAAMAILQGLQEIQNFLQKESAGMILLQTIRTKAQTIATNIQTAATVGETVAQRALNVAIAATPIGLFIVGLTAAIALISSMTSETKDAAEEIRELESAIEDYYSTVESLNKSNSFANERTRQIRDNEELIKKYELTGGKLKEINQLKKENIDLELVGLYAAKNAADRKRADLKAIGADEAKVAEAIGKVNDINDEIYRKQQERSRADIQYSKDKAAAEKDAADKAKQAAQQAIERSKEALKERKALIDIELAELKAAGREEEDIYLDKQKAAIDAQAKISALEVKGANERLLIFKKAEQEKRDLTNAFNLKNAETNLETQRKQIDAEYTAAREGSEEQLKLKREQLQNEADQEEVRIRASELNEQDKVARILALNKKLKSDLKKLDDDDDRQKLQLAAEVKSLNDQSEILTKQRELIGVKDKKQIAKINAEIAQIRKEGVLDEIKLNEDLHTKGLITEEEYQKLKLGLTNQYASEENTAIKDAFEERERITHEYYERINKSLESTFTLINQSIDQTIVNGDGIKSALGSAMQAYQEFIKIQQSDATQAEKNRAIAVAGIAAAQQTINGIFADAARRRQDELNAQLSDLDEAKQKELANKNLTEEQKDAINEKYRKKEAAAKRQAWEADKRARRSQAVINTALAVVNALATAPTIIAGIALAAVAGVMGAVQIAKISSEQPPKFKKGKVNIPGPGTTTSDSIPAMISRGESVINAKSTSKWEDALTAINNDKFEHWLDNRFNDFAYPEVPGYTYKAFEEKHSGGIDYDKLATALAKKLPEPTYVNNSFDEGGFSSWVSKGGNKTRYHNRKFNV